MAVSENQKKSRNKYDDKTYKKYPIKFRIEEYEALKYYCEGNGIPLNGFVRQVVMKAIKEEK